MSECHAGGEWQVLIYNRPLWLGRRGPGVNGNKKVSSGGARALGLMWGGDSCGTLLPHTP